ncbi:MAG: AsnC family transcriptional regulator [Nitrososphaerota archaeon]|nr:AsnC family transcriptional regulator [Nitrososphaerota archaeon]
MDVTDFRILAAMGLSHHSPNGTLHRRPSVAKMARDLGVDPKTVRARVGKMERVGLIKYYQAFPNLSALGLRCSVYVFQFSDRDTKRKAMSKLRLLDEVQMVDEYVHSLRVVLLYEGQDDVEKRLALMSELTGVVPTKLFDVPMPPLGMKLSATDMKILRALRWDALKPARKVGEEVGLTARAVNYRLNRMADARAYFAVPVWGLESVSGTIVYAFSFFLLEEDREGTINRIAQRFAQRSVCWFAASEGVVFFMLFSDSVGEPERMYEAARSMAGVSKVLMDMFVDTHDLPGLVDKMLNRQARRPSSEIPGQKRR